MSGILCPLYHLGFLWCFSDIEFPASSVHSCALHEFIYSWFSAKKGREHQGHRAFIMSYENTTSIIPSFWWVFLSSSIDVMMTSSETVFSYFTGFNTSKTIISFGLFRRSWANTCYANSETSNKEKRFDDKTIHLSEREDVWRREYISQGILEDVEKRRERLKFDWSSSVLKFCSEVEFCSVVTFVSQRQREGQEKRRRMNTFHEDRHYITHRRTSENRTFGDDKN